MSRFDMPSVFRAMNAHFGVEIVRAVITGLEPDMNFSRVSASSEMLDHSFGTLMQVLDAERLSLPVKFVVNGSIVNLAAGHGYTGQPESNPNASGMGSVTHEVGTAVAVTYADAPSATIVHPQSGVVAAVSGIWQFLSLGTVDETIEHIRELVEAQGLTFRVSDLWINLSAGAREESFFIDRNGRNKLLDPFRPNETDDGAELERKLRLYQLYSERIIPVFDQDREFGLDLSGLFYALWVNAGVRKDQIGFDPRNTMTARDENGTLILPSRRTSEALGNKAYSSAVQAIVWTGNVAN